MDNTEHIIQELKSEKWEMAQEIERLREALQTIVDCDPSDFEVTDIVEFARSALQQKETEDWGVKVTDDIEWR